jgi:hypothetical protein
LILHDGQRKRVNDISWHTGPKGQTVIKRFSNLGQQAQLAAWPLRDIVLRNLAIDQKPGYCTRCDIGHLSFDIIKR